MKFICEIKELKASKKGLDLEYSIKLITDDPELMSLSLIKADELVIVDITREKGK